MSLERKKISDSSYQVWCGNTLFATFNFCETHWQAVFPGYLSTLPGDADGESSVFDAEDIYVDLAEWQIHSIIAMFKGK